MPATADELRELHDLHRRAKGLRDRLESGPKTLAARQRGLQRRRDTVAKAQADLKQAKVEIQRQELQVQSQRARVADLRVKLNATKKNDEYKAITSEIAMINKAVDKLEDEALEAMQGAEAAAASLAELEADAAEFAEGVEALRLDIESKSGDQRAKLDELERTIRESESIVPADDRDRYRRVVKQRGDDAFAGVDRAGHACEGCNQVVTMQDVNELMNVTHLVFCKICGRILYLADE